jgi:D-xylose 1-dehydrogenase (NADP+, D-xylono-1,5-lactone-forming)
MILRWGILGVARINRALIPPLQASDRNQLVGIASRDEGRAREAAQQWRIPKHYGSYEAMLADPDIDVVYVPLPNDLHVEWTVRAARAGKHVLCEKPLALSVEDVDRIAEAARESGVVVAEAFMYRHHPQTLRVREMAASGELGRVRLVHGSFTFNLDRADDVRLNPAQGGGSVWDIGCYPVSFARVVLAEEAVEAFGWSVTEGAGVDTTFAGQLRFPSGALASFDCGFRAPFRTRIEVVGEKAIVVVPRPFKPGEEERILVNRGTDEPEEIVIPGADLYRGEVEDLYDAAILHRSPRVSLADSRANVATLAALLRSAREGRPVPV